MGYPDHLEDQIDAFWRDYPSEGNLQHTIWDYSYSFDEDACQADSEGLEDRVIGSESDYSYHNLSFDSHNHDLGADTAWMWNEASCAVDSQSILLSDPLLNYDNFNGAHEESSCFANPIPDLTGEQSLATSSQQFPPTSGTAHDASISHIEEISKSNSSFLVVRNDTNKHSHTVLTRNTNAGSSRVNRSGGVTKPKKGRNDPWMLEDKIDNARSTYATLVGERQEARSLCNSLMGISNVSTTDQPPPPGASKQSLDPDDTKLAGKSLLTALTNRNSQIRSEIKMIKLQIDIRNKSQ
ncbi:uncharacterized protein L199_001297 [Kwoniella botswanensis]|uniref:uncharacterized protein n=1 Tax=Kwoniella botswanensis TaxID=1268659 RepID=UPI00315DEEBE